MLCCDLHWVPELIGLPVSSYYCFPTLAKFSPPFHLICLCILRHSQHWIKPSTAEPHAAANALPRALLARLRPRRAPGAPSLTLRHSDTTPRGAGEPPSAAPAAAPTLPHGSCGCSTRAGECGASSTRVHLPPPAPRAPAPAGAPAPAPAGAAIPDGSRRKAHGISRVGATLAPLCTAALL